MNRRDFLVSSAAGALVVGCAFGPTGGPVWQHHRRTGEFKPSAWIRILPDSTIVIVIDRVEMGQGTTTSSAMMVCEELEVDPKVVKVEAASSSRAYDNPDPQLGIQITGGSTSTASSWKPLREAGAVAREMLRRGAADVWKVPLAQCVAREGAVHHGASGRSLRYGELVDAAARQDVPKVTLKKPGEWKVIGKSIDRLDAAPKVDGSGVYGIDMKLPGMRQAVVVRPPVRGAAIATLDVAAAKARRGVVDVFAIPEGIAVVAEGYWEARTAAELVKVTWHDGAGGAIDTAKLIASAEKLLDGKGDKAHAHGDAYAAVKRGTRVEARYRLPHLAHAPMEPMNATAQIRNGRCDVWAPTQAPGIAQFRVAEALGMDLQDVAIHTTMLGGGFGRRLYQDFCVEAARIAARVGPVKVTWSREDDQANDWYRPMAMSSCVGSVEGGQIVGWLHRLTCESVLAATGGDFVGPRLPNGAPRALRRMFADSPPRMFARDTILDPTSIEGTDPPYAIPNFRVEYLPLDTGVRVGSWRSVGNSHTGFVVESFFDELCVAAKLDPYEARRKLLAKAPRHLGVLELAAHKAGWGAPLPPGVGRGIAMVASFKSFCAQVIEASVEGNRVKVHRVVAAVDCGRVVNPGLVAAQVESSIIYGLSACLKQQITFAKGRVQETNFNSFRSLRMFETPVIETHIVPSTESPTGIGEPGLPPVAPALCNAIFAATGKRIRTLPIEQALGGPA
ncbi:MAG: xanthine dehydrogenase family protein molybdopterin-binding subunit [Deltaproteobacteria bacterium]|nr:xanthine dehydrogenase family protein molybdopterin-binding subunit [Deltaproteobacteria bacterium]